jgi:hypothetical protein
MHWTLPQVRALSCNDFDVLVDWLIEQQPEAE